ncbi:MAG: histidine phosphatase family protein [Acidimicrobiia bacterium]|nr:histidine phosphatase family protein [Acidimicrobiia bacterium]
MLHLMLLRHGKSDWDADLGDDHTRPLAPRGVRSARAIGIAVRDRDIVPALVVSSTAVRARSTAELARVAGGWSSRLVLDDDLYGASVADVLEVAARHGAAHRRVMLVGHQPTWGLTVRALTGGSVDVRTGTLVDIELVADTWPDIAGAPGSVVAVLQPRALLEHDEADDE